MPDAPSTGTRENNAFILEYHQSGTIGVVLFVGSGIVPTASATEFTINTARTMLWHGSHARRRGERKNPFHLQITLPCAPPQTNPQPGSRSLQLQDPPPESPHSHQGMHDSKISCLRTTMSRTLKFLSTLRTLVSPTLLSNG